MTIVGENCLVRHKKYCMSGIAKGVVSVIRSKQEVLLHNEWIIEAKEDFGGKLTNRPLVKPSDRLVCGCGFIFERGYLLEQHDKEYRMYGINPDDFCAVCSWREKQLVNN